MRFWLYELSLTLACVGGFGQIKPDCGVLSLSVRVVPTGLLLLISRAYRSRGNWLCVIFWADTFPLLSSLFLWWLFLCPSYRCLQNLFTQARHRGPAWHDAVVVCVVASGYYWKHTLAFLICTFVFIYIIILIIYLSNHLNSFQHVNILATVTDKKITILFLVIWTEGKGQLKYEFVTSSLELGINVCV